MMNENFELAYNYDYYSEPEDEENSQNSCN